MNCIYCNQPCHLIPAQKASSKAPSITHWRCKQCSETHFRHIENESQTYSIAIYFSHKEKKYLYYEYRNVHKSTAHFYQVSKRISLEDSLRVPLPNNINPKNVKEKFMTYCLFS